MGAQASRTVLHRVRTSEYTRQKQLELVTILVSTPLVGFQELFLVAKKMEGRTAQAN